MVVYDIVIVGAGSIGSSAAYHLSQDHPDLSVALIGPGEPAVKDLSRDTFGCHYDEGRITRVLAPYEGEQILALRSTQQYSKLESLSNMKIYNEVGVLIYSDDNNPSSKITQSMQSYVSTTDEFCRKNGIKLEKISSKEKLQKMFPYFDNPSETVKGSFVKEKSGYISIRNLVSATQSVAAASGITRIKKVATSISKNPTDGSFEITLEDRDIMQCRKVILSTGSFVNFKELLPRKLDIKLCSHVVMKFELSEDDVKKLDGFPSFLTYAYSDDDFYIYGAPPIKYPNGKTYLKVGHTVDPTFIHTRNFTEQKEVQEWYCKTDDATLAPYLRSRFEKALPGIQPLSEELDFCVMTMTKSGRQYLGFVEPNFLVATGGNGKSAKMALELGRICVKCAVKGEWDYDLPSDYFTISYMDNNYL